MTIFIIGVVLAVAVASTYVTLGVRDFLRIRREVSRAADADGGATLESSGDAPVDAGREHADEDFARLQLRYGALAGREHPRPAGLGDFDCTHGIP